MFTHSVAIPRPSGREWSGPGIQIFSNVAIIDHLCIPPNNLVDLSIRCRPTSTVAGAPSIEMISHRVGRMNDEKLTLLELLRAVQNEWG
jgi:hypothetical protein